MGAATVTPLKTPGRAIAQSIRHLVAAEDALQAAHDKLDAARSARDSAAEDVAARLGVWEPLQAGPYLFDFDPTAPNLLRAVRRVLSVNDAIKRAEQKP